MLSPSSGGLCTAISGRKELEKITDDMTVAVLAPAMGLNLECLPVLVADVAVADLYAIDDEREPVVTRCLPSLDGCADLTGEKIKFRRGQAVFNREDLPCGITLSSFRS